METVGGVDGLKERGRFRHDKRESRNLPVPQLLQCGILVIVRDLGLDAEKIEHARRRKCRTAALHVDVYGLPGEIGDFLYVGARQQMKLLIIELGDIGQRILDAGEQALVAGVFERIDRQDRDIDAAKMFQIGNVLQTSFAEHGHDAARRTVIDNTCDLLRHPHRNIPGSAGDKLDHAAVADGRTLPRTGGLRRRPDPGRTDADADGHDQRACCKAKHPLIPRYSPCP